MITTMCPVIADKERVGVCKAAELLGISRRSMLNYLKGGLLKYSVSKHNGYKKITGAEVKRFWKLVN